MVKFAEHLQSNEESARYLLESEDYRDFLKRFFSLKKKIQPSFSYNVFARHASVAKSLPRDIISGEKRLTEKVLPRFISAMDLPHFMEEYFIQLVNSENGISDPDYRKKLSLFYLDHHFIKKHTTDNFKNPIVPFIYAASGALSEGSTLETIAERTGLPLENIKKSIPLMETLKLGNFDQAKGRFIPSATQVHVESSEQKEHFINFYKFCMGLQDKALDQQNHGSNLFYNEVFSVNEKDLPLLAQELKKTLKSFVLKNEEASGNCVSILNLGLFKHRF